MEKQRKIKETLEKQASNILKNCLSDIPGFPIGRPQDKVVLVVFRRLSRPLKRLFKGILKGLLKALEKAF